MPEIALDKNKILQMNPLVLAFVGDAVETLRVRTRFALEDSSKSHELHLKTAREINAHAQSEDAEKVLPYLTEEEAAVYRRARNSKAHHHAKNYSEKEYRRASGLEAVLGYLYLAGEEERLEQLFEIMENV